MTLRCELSKPAAVVQWKKDSEILKPGEKYDMKQAEGSCILQILNLKIEDSGAYTCVCADEKTSAALKVTGMDSCFFQHSFGNICVRIFKEIQFCGLVKTVCMI